MGENKYNNIVYLQNHVYKKKQELKKKKIETENSLLLALLSVNESDQPNSSNIVIKTV